MLKPKWGSQWDELGVLDLPRVGRGDVPFLAAYRHEDVDEWNAFLMKGRRLFPAAQARAEAELYRRSVREALDALPDETFAEGQLVHPFCTIVAQHEAAHAEEIRAWRDATGV